MKRFLLLVTALVLIVGVVSGCGGEVPTYIDADKTITVAVGDEFTIALDRDAGGGFRWELAYDRAYLRMSDEEYNSGEKAEGLSGEGGTHYYRFEALQAGDTVIDLGYKRPRDTDLTDAKLFRVVIE